MVGGGVGGGPSRRPAGRILQVIGSMLFGKREAKQHKKTAPRGFVRAHPESDGARTITTTDLLVMKADPASCGSAHSPSSQAALIGQARDDAPWRGDYAVIFGPWRDEAIDDAGRRTDGARLFFFSRRP